MGSTVPLLSTPVLYNPGIESALPGIAMHRRRIQAVTKINEHLVNTNAGKDILGLHISVPSFSFARKITPVTSL
jgi:hypothetical protein